MAKARTGDAPPNTTDGGTKDPEFPMGDAQVEREIGDMATVTATVKENAARRAADRGAGGFSAQHGMNPNYGPMIPMPGDEAAGRTAAEYEAGLIEEELAMPAYDAERLRLLNETYDVFLRCPIAHPRRRTPHALYLTEYPTGDVIPYDKWKSRQKPKAEDVYHPLELWCQACAMDNTLTAAKAQKVTPKGDLKVMTRFLFRRPKDPKRLAVEGETRCFAVQHSSMNYDREKALQRSREAGFEVYD